MRIFRFLFIFLLSCTSQASNGNSEDKLPRVDNYLSRFVNFTDVSNCYCSTQNEFELPLTINRKLYPYRGEFAKASNEILFKDRIRTESFDSEGVSKATDLQATYYCRYWDPEVNSQKKTLVDVVMTQLFNSEVELEFNEAVLDTATGTIQSMLVPDQKHKITQFGKITNYPHLKSHWYQLSTMDTKIEQRDLGVYSQVTHFFIWSGRTFSVTFNFDHNPSDMEMYEIHQFFLHFGEKCTLQNCAPSELIELKALLKQYYSMGYETLYGLLSEDEKEQVISCAIEKYRQIYTCDEFMNGTIDADEFDEIATGCIEFMKL